MFNRILVPLDGSTIAERTIPHAAQFARIFGSDIILLQVLDPVSYHENPKPVDPLNWQIRKAEAEIYMKELTTQLLEDLGESSIKNDGSQSKSAGIKNERVEFVILEGKTAENIINFAHTENIDLVVLSTHGSSGLSRWNISSVTQKVIEQIYLPILIIRSYKTPEMESKRICYRDILLPIDSSRRSENALSAGISIIQSNANTNLDSPADPLEPHITGSAATPLKKKLILATVIKPPELPIPEPFPVEVEQLSEKFLQVCREAVRDYLNKIKDQLPVKCETVVLENKSVPAAIHELANQKETIDLVVLSAHGYTGQSNWPYGSVTRNFIEHGTKPVLVIQDVPRAKVQPTAAEIAAEKTGGR